MLNREFIADKLNQKWASDITYIWTDEGWLYLAGIMDLCGRTIVGFSMASHMRKSLIISVLKQAIGKTKAGEGLLAHSDRGAQYASHAYQKLLKKNGFKCSMSHRDNCWDNAPMESFWGKLEQEWLYGNRFRTRDEAKAAIFEYIEIYYNRQRKHSSNNYKSSNGFYESSLVKTTLIYEIICYSTNYLDIVRLSCLLSRGKANFEFIQITAIYCFCYFHWSSVIEIGSP